MCEWSITSQEVTRGSHERQANFGLRALALACGIWTACVRPLIRLSLTEEMADKTTVGKEHGSAGRGGDHTDFKKSGISHWIWSLIARGNDSASPHAPAYIGSAPFPAEHLSVSLSRPRNLTSVIYQGKRPRRCQTYSEWSAQAKLKNLY